MKLTDAIDDLAMLAHLARVAGEGVTEEELRKTLYVDSTLAADDVLTRIPASLLLTALQFSQAGSRYQSPPTDSFCTAGPALTLSVGVGDGNMEVIGYLVPYQTSADSNVEYEGLVSDALRKHVGSRFADKLKERMRDDEARIRAAVNMHLACYNAITFRHPGYHVTAVTMKFDGSPPTPGILTGVKHEITRETKNAGA